MEEKTAQLEAVLRSIGSGLIVTGQAGKIVLINDAACQMLGWQREEAEGRVFTEVLPMEVMSPAAAGEMFEEEPILNVLATGKKTTNYYLIRKDKTKFPAELTTSSVIYNGEVIGATISFVDITHQIEAERAKSDFVAIASHQLRTPLGSIRWNLEMLMEEEFGPLSEAAKKTLREIYDSNRRMIDLVNDLLDVSRIEQGRVPNNPQPTEFAPLVAAVMEELKGLAGQKSQTLVMENNCFSPKINIDPKRLREVVENLVDNAIKYTPEGGEIRIKVEGDEREIRFSVADTGLGIPEAEQDRMFDRFFRAGNALKTQTEGSGLGLYIAKAYVESWGGRLWFTSREGQGSTFYFKIPIL
jgi:PAS domain S-box-containing protein